MFGALAIGLGGLLLASKKVRKEIKRFGRKVKKKLKKIVKSKAFKIIAAAALIATGVYFVAGMLGTAGTAATVATNTAAANAAATTAASTSGIIARTATAIANGARTAGSAVYGAGSSTTAFLSKGFESVKNVATSGKESTGFSSTPIDAAADFEASKLADAVATATKQPSTFGIKPKPSFIAKDPSILDKIKTVTDYGTPEILKEGTGTVAERAITTAAAGPKFVTAPPEGSSLLQKAGRVKTAYDKATEKQQKEELIPQPSFSTLQDDFEGTAITAAEAMQNFSNRYPLLDPNIFKSNFNPNSFYSYKNLVRQP